MRSKKYQFYKNPLKSRFKKINVVIDRAHNSLDKMERLTAMMLRDDKETREKLLGKKKKKKNEGNSIEKEKEQVTQNPAPEVRRTRNSIRSSKNNNKFNIKVRTTNEFSKKSNDHSKSRDENKLTPKYSVQVSRRGSNFSRNSLSVNNSEINDKTSEYDANNDNRVSKKEEVLYRIVEKEGKKSKPVIAFVTTTSTMRYEKGDSQLGEKRKKEDLKKIKKKSRRFSVLAMARLAQGRRSSIFLRKDKNDPRNLSLYSKGFN